MRHARTGFSEVRLRRLCRARRALTPASPRRASSNQEASSLAELDAEFTQLRCKTEVEGVRGFDEAQHSRFARLFHDADVPDSAGLALLRACSSGDAEAVKAALRAGGSCRLARSLAPDSLGWSPAHFAAAGGHTLALRALVSSSSKAALQAEIVAPIKVTYYGTPQRSHRTDKPLHTAVRAGQTDAVKTLLELGAEINAYGACDYTPLHIATERGDLAMCNLLCDAGADPCKRTCPKSGQGQRDALDLAKNRATLALLTKAVRRRETNHGLPDVQKIFAFSKAGDSDALRAQLALCADAASRALVVCSVDERTRSPLHYATRNGHAECMLMLLDAGSTPHTADADGNTALHLAAHRGDVRFMEALLNVWPDDTPVDSLQNEDGKSPVDLTEVPSVLRLLREKATAQTLATPPSRSSHAGSGAVPAELADWMAALDLSQHTARLVAEHKVRAVDELKVLDADDLKNSGLSKVEVHRFIAAAATLSTRKAYSPVSPGDVSPACSVSLSSSSSSTGSWHFFLSHFQRNGGPQMAQLRAEMLLVGRRAWFDKNENPTEEGMMHGVANSEVFLLFLTRDVFTRTYCLREIRKALELGKPFILLREAAETPVYRADDDTMKRSSASIEELKAEAPGDLKRLFEHLLAIEHRQEAHEREAMIKKICSADTAKLVPAARAADAMARSLWP